MHCAIDVREACRESATGKGRWTKGFVTELLSRPVSLTLFSDADLPPEWYGNISARDNVAVRVLPERGMRWHIEVASVLRNDCTADFYVSPTSYIVPRLVGKSFRCIPVLHDLIAFLGEPHERRATFIERVTLGCALTHAPLICTTSEATKRDLLKRYPKLSQDFLVPIFAGPTMHASAQTVPDNKTIVCLGTLCPRKNQKRLIEAFAMLPEPLKMSHQLLIVGKRGWRDDDIVKLASAVPGVQWMSYLPDRELDRLLARTTVLAFPSLYEGFGMPVLDAFMRGIPVLTSDRGSLKEVAGDAAVIVDPLSVSSICDGLTRLLEQHVLRQNLIQKGHDRARYFSWKNTVDLFLDAADRLPPP